MNEARAVPRVSGSAGNAARDLELSLLLSYVNYCTRPAVPRGEPVFHDHQE